MTWADQQRTVPPPGKDYASSQARRAWASAGAGPFGIADVGLPPASGAMAGLPSPEPRPSAASGGAGLPPAQFLQQPPGSASFLDASTRVSAREVVPAVGAVTRVEVPLWRMGPGGGLPPGLRVPFGEVLSPTPFLENSFSFERVTGFNPEWGEPPTVEALAWNPERALYEPSDDPRLSGAGVSGYTGSAHVPSYLKHYHAHYVDMASRQMHVQAYRDATGTGNWSFRWVRAATPWPEVTAPYVVMGPYERFALPTGTQAVTSAGEARGDHPARALEGQTRPGYPTPAPTLGGPARRDWGSSVVGGARTLEYREPVIRPRPPRELTLQDFAWVPQRLLPAGCPYPEAYLPVPLADYTSGRWLEVDYTPSLPLPRPYNQLPAWRCGVVGTPGKEHKGSPPGPGNYGPNWWTSHMSLGLLLEHEALLEATFGKYLGRSGNVLENASDLSPTDRVQVEVLAGIRREIGHKLSRLREERRTGDPIKREKLAHAQLALLGQLLAQVSLSAERQRDLAFETRAAERDLASSVGEQAEQRAGGSLPGPAALPGSSGGEHLEMLQRQEEEVTAALREAARNPVPRDAPPEVHEEARAEAERLNDELTSIREELDRLDAGTGGYAPGASRDAPPVGVPPDIVARGGAEGPQQPQPSIEETRKREKIARAKITFEIVKKKVRARELLRDGIYPPDHRTGGSQKIDAALSALLVTLEQAPPGPGYPGPHLDAILWALGRYADDQGQAIYRKDARAPQEQVGEVKGISPYPANEYKCNKLVADAYAVGAGVGLSVGTNTYTSQGANGLGFPAAKDSTGVWGPMANELASQEQNLRSLTNARDVDEGAGVPDARRTGVRVKVKPKAGDIIAFPNAGGLGHSSLYLGDGLIVSAKSSGVEIGQLESERQTHGGVARVRQWTGSGR